MPVGLSNCPPILLCHSRPTGAAELQFVSQSIGAKFIYIYNRLHATRIINKMRTDLTHLYVPCGKLFKWGTRWPSWFRHGATSRKVAGSIPDGVVGIFQLHKPSGRTMALGLTQPLTEMSTRNISWG